MEYLPGFFAAAGYSRKDGAVVLKATNYLPTPVRTEVQLEGAATVGSAGRHLVIRGKGPEDENTLDDPRRIVPQELPLPGCAAAFTVELPPLSVNVLRIPATRAP